MQNQDIGFVRAGQTVRLKLATYPFQKYGMLDGKVETVIADASAESARAGGSSATSGDSGNGSTSMADSSAYKAIIRLTGQEMKTNGLSLPLAAGMQLTAEIVEDQRTVLEYLLSPVQRIASEAGRER